MKHILVPVITILLSTGYCYAQLEEPDDEPIDYAAALAALEAELDSVGIFNLIDSVLTAELKVPSEFNVRFGYNSNVTNAGRNYGINQYGFSPGLSFYHSSGLFADVAGYWNSEFDPKYNVTLGTIGYMGTFGKKFSYTASYEKWFYHGNDTESQINTSPTNSLSASVNYNLKHFSAGIDYSYLFGEESAHRLIGSIMGNWTLNSFWKKRRITFLPSISMLYGNENITIQFNGDLIDEIKSNSYVRENLQSDKFKEFLATVELTDQERDAIQQILRSRILTPEDKRKLIAVIYLNKAEVQNYVYDLLETQSNVYGIMNYNLSLPVSLSFGNLTTLISYSYSIPVKLPGETVELDPIGLFSLTLIYRIPLR